MTEKATLTNRWILTFLSSCIVIIKKQIDVYSLIIFNKIKKKSDNVYKKIIKTQK